MKESMRQIKPVIKYRQELRFREGLHVDYLKYICFTSIIFDCFSAECDNSTLTNLVSGFYHPKQFQVSKVSGLPFNFKCNDESDRSFKVLERNVLKCLYLYSVLIRVFRPQCGLDAKLLSIVLYQL